VCVVRAGTYRSRQRSVRVLLRSPGGKPADRVRQDDTVSSSAIGVSISAVVVFMVVFMVVVVVVVVVVVLVLVSVLESVSVSVSESLFVSASVLWSVSMLG
jgi:hypothetical protein